MQIHDHVQIQTGGGTNKKVFGVALEDGNVFVVKRKTATVYQNDAVIQRGYKWMKS